jgi:hypothetical protein
MDRTAAAIIQDFHTLTAADFDDDDPAANGWTRLQALCDEAHDLGGPACMPAMFDVMERLDHADLGWIPRPARTHHRRVARPV